MMRVLIQIKRGCPKTNRNILFFTVYMKLFSNSENMFENILFTKVTSFFKLIEMGLES